MKRTKYSIAVFVTILAIQYATLAIADSEYIYNGEIFAKKQIKNFERGRITEFSNLEEFCDR